MVPVFRRILSFGVISLFFGSVAFAQNIRSAVSIDGFDGNPCTIASPCRTFGAAIAVTNPNGEVIVLTSGGYGPFTIDRSVSIISPEGIHAAIAPTAGSAITVNGGGLFIAVFLRNLWLNGQGAEVGLNVVSGGRIHVEDCVINRFDVGSSSFGILYQNALGGYLSVKDSRISLNGIAGLAIRPAFTSQVVVERSRFENNANPGIQVQPAAAGSAKIVIADSLISYNARGIVLATVGGAIEMNVERCIVAHNVNHGILGGNDTRIIRVAESHITGNGTGVEVFSGDNLRSYGNNRLAGNTANGTFTSTIPLL